ncbi:MAG: hypothetical protein JXJ22_01925 [Bacteroidales bacterium]|nr:hypothetical protein [Bacteroidales bacterium]
MEGIISVGSAQVFGDIGGAADANSLFGLKDLQFDETRPAFGLGVRYKIDQRYSVKLNLNLGFGSASDFGSVNSERNFSYKTTLFETALLGEFYFLQDNRKRQTPAMFNRRGMINNYSVLSSYVFTGLTPLLFWPKFEGTTRGEHMDKITGYSKISVGIPLGLGVKYTIDDSWIFGIELGGRYVFSDFIDGYTNLLFSKSNDIYYLLLFSFNYRIETSPKGLPRFLDKRYRRALR